MFKEGDFQNSLISRQPEIDDENTRIFVPRDVVSNYESLRSQIIQDACNLYLEKSVQDGEDSSKNLQNLMTGTEKILKKSCRRPPPPPSR
jgi:hypothetical protein